MGEPSQERRLFREAVDLAIRLQEDLDNPALRNSVRAWVARGPDHQRAWQQVSAIHGMTGKLLAGQGADTRSPNRRQLIAGCLAGFGLLATGAAFGPGLMLAARADYLTDRADMRSIQLADGSLMVLGPDSAVAVRLDGQRREVDLLQGMAFFDVSHDQRSDFAVLVGDTVIEGAFSAFDVSLDADFVSVSVDHGRVRIGTGPDSDLLEAGQWLKLAPDAGAIAGGQREISQIAAWRQKMLVAEEEMVAVMIARIARWHHGRVMVTDRDLEQRLVSGVFNLDDPVLALQAVVQPFGGKVRQVGPLTVVSSA